MDLSLTMLGTAATSPTRTRGVSAQLIQYGNYRFLVDCGEGTQRQLQLSGAGLAGLDAILFSHWHADHYLGLFGLLKTLASRERAEPLLLAGPRGFVRYLDNMRGTVGRLPFELQELELGDDELLCDGFRLVARRSDHTTPSLAWALAEDDQRPRLDAVRAAELGVPDGPLMGQLARGEDVELPDGRTVRAAELLGAARRGRRIVISGDTRPCNGVRELADRAEVLVHEATFLECDPQIDGMAMARKTGHCTAADAARIAQQTSAQLTMLTHISSRYAARQVLAEARQAGSGANLQVARDFDRVEVPLADRGAVSVVGGGQLQLVSPRY